MIIVSLKDDNEKENQVLIGNGHGNRNGTGESVASAQSHFPFSHDNPIQRHPNPGPPSTPTGKKSRKSEPRQAPPAGFSPHGLKDLIACMPPATMKNLAAGNSRLERDLKSKKTINVRL